MEDNRRTTHSVDDYYPKPSRDEEPSQENLSNRPDAEDTDANDTRADRTDSYGSYADASDENGGAGFSDNSRDEDPYGQSSHSSEEYAGGTLTCPRCGNEVPANMNFCSLCGYHFPKTADTPYPLNNTRIDGYLADDIAQFVGPNYNTCLLYTSRCV